MCGLVCILDSSSSDSENYSEVSIIDESFRAISLLQNRGEDASGITLVDYEKNFETRKSLGVIDNLIESFDINVNGRYQSSIVHTRYTTIGTNSSDNIQPFSYHENDLNTHMVHNGNIVNYYSLKDKILRLGIPLKTTSDLEVLHLIWRRSFEVYKGHDNNLFDSICKAVKKVFNCTAGAYSVSGIIPGEGMFAFKDPNGMRPLCLGKKGDYYCFASESNVLDELGYTFISELKAGEVIFISNSGNIQRKIVSSNKESFCMFEKIYFSNTKTTFDNNNILDLRMKLGQKLAINIISKLKKDNLKVTDFDYIVPIPSSSIPAAKGVSDALELPYAELIKKRAKSNRSFIQSNQKKREVVVNSKFIFNEHSLRGKSVILVDDSIVRGTTIKKVVKSLRSIGCKKIAVASSCPEIKYPCYYGIDFPSPEQLISNNYCLESIKSILGVDSIVFNDVNDILDICGEKSCTACLSSLYPTSVKEGLLFGELRGLTL